MSKGLRASKGKPDRTEQVEIPPIVPYVGLEKLPFDKEAATFIVEQMADLGLSMRAVLRLPSLLWPNGRAYKYLTIAAWMDSNPSFALSIARARSGSAEVYFDEIMNTVRNMDDDSVTVDRERIRALQWAAKVCNPRQYGDKREVSQDLTVTHEQRHVIDVADLDQASRDQLRAALMQAERLSKPTV